jgi:peptide chain release factor
MFERFVTQKKQATLLKQMLEIGINESDLEEKFICGSGSGGQKLNKTASCVYLKHIPTGTEIKCQQTRTRALNRYYARKRLCEVLDEKINGKKSKAQLKIDKIRKQKKKSTQRCMHKLLQSD